jgi:quinol monooxygenase YgiN
MRSLWGLAICGTIATALTISRPGEAAEAGGPVYAVTYFEAAPADLGKIATAVKEYVAASRKEAGNLAFAAFEEIGRPSRFAILSGWESKAASDAHTGAAPAAAFAEKVQPLLLGLFEVRDGTAFSLAPPAATAAPAAAVYGLTHVDVFPAGKDQTAALVTALAEANRKLPGNLRFDVLRIVGHPNHFTLVQGWRDRKAFDDSLMAASTRAFREKLTPLEGALYDERLYHALQ